ncbi:hypothetical protein H4R33_006544 [Dimargaris cristalligena]|nr:hypothetical protein H4R33_006544 [Dimargaris cristalligena]
MASLPVSTYLQEPFFQTPVNKRKRLIQRIMQISGQLELLLNREKTDYVQVVLLDDKADKLTRLLKTLVAEHDEQSRPLQAFFQETGFGELFPCAMARLSLETLATGKIVKNTGIHAHFQSLTSLNQLIDISLQLQHNLELANHRFVPHQLTVLYQSLGTAGVEYKKYKAKVEIEFDRIKAYLAGEAGSSKKATNRMDHDEPYGNHQGLRQSPIPAVAPDGVALTGRTRLSDYHQKWLRELTSEIVIEALYKKGPIRHASKPLAKVLEC